MKKKPSKRTVFLPHDLNQDMIAQYIGSVIEVHWVDPAQADCDYNENIPSGMNGLAKWTEYGKLLAINEAVITLAHTMAEDPPVLNTTTKHSHLTWIPICLISAFEILKPDPSAVSQSRKPKSRRAYREAH